MVLALPPAAVVELMGRIEEACTNRHNYRMRARGFDCTLQMLLTWPERKLGRNRLNLARVLHAGCSDANAYVRACARRGTMAMALRLPVHGGRLRGELDRATDALVGEEEAWVQRQLTEGCSFGVGDGSAPESHEVISAPVPGPDPGRQDFTIGAGPGEETRVHTPRTGFEMRQIVKSLSTEIRSVLASAAYTIEEAFREFDADGNGTLDPGELRQGWATVAVPPGCLLIRGVLTGISLRDSCSCHEIKGETAGAACTRSGCVSRTRTWRTSCARRTSTATA